MAGKQGDKKTDAPGSRGNPHVAGRNSQAGLQAHKKRQGSPLPKPNQVG